MTAKNEEITFKDASRDLEKVIDIAAQVILGKEDILRLALSCLLAKGHLLIEDLPGVGKTTMSHVLANSLGLSFQRIQFTSDLLPADILGVSVYNRETGAFTFHPGPIFSQVVLADEVNRATPRAQSALLEAMEETQVTIDGQTLPLPKPFFVIATQNPFNQIGTYHLPESQLDRFTMRIKLGYPDTNAERELLKGRDRRELLAELEPALSPDHFQVLQKQAETIIVSDPLLDYLQDLIEYSRASGEYISGLSPRAGLAAKRCAQAWALLQGRGHVTPEDIQAILPSVIAHRLILVNSNIDDQQVDASHNLIKQVPIP
jgi:MoxR-like ATPase